MTNTNSIAAAALALAACGGLDPAAETLFCTATDPCPPPRALALGAGGGAPPDALALELVLGAASSTGSSGSGAADAGQDSGDASCGRCHALLAEDVPEADACPGSGALWQAYVACACQFGQPCYAACAAQQNYCDTHRWQDASPACAACQVGPCGPAYWACSNDK